MTHDDDGDDSELYDITVTTFDDVTRFRNPTSDDQDEDYFRLYDAETETLAYATTSGTGSHEAVVLATRDATTVDFSA
jgi:hypothetical protein